MTTNSDKLKNKLTADEVNRYWDVYFAVVDTLFIAQGRLRGLEDRATDLGDRSGYRADRLRVEADIELMRAKRMAFNANRSPISPPDQQTVDEVVALSKRVADKTVTRGQAAAIVQIAADVVNEFKKLQNV